MQTFLPYRSFEKTARCLDYRRLGKQRVEAYQILLVLEGKSTGWKNHPAVLMWKGWIPELRYYMNCMIAEWIRRGYKNTMKPIPYQSSRRPWWLTSKVMRSYRSNLLRKDPAYYGKFKWKVPNNLPYAWPVTKEDRGASLAHVWSPRPHMVLIPRGSRK